MKANINFDPAVRPVYLHLEPIVQLLLEHGNELARSYRWGEDRTGFHCLLSKGIDFDLVRKEFEIPDFIRLDVENDAIECDITWASIKGNIAPKLLVKKG